MIRIGVIMANKNYLGTDGILYGHVMVPNVLCWPHYLVLGLYSQLLDE